MAQTHTLKTIDRYFEAVERGEKTFDVRLHDRDFQIGDKLVLVKVYESGYYIPAPGSQSGQITLEKTISYILQGGQFGIEPAFCVLGLSEK